MNEEIKITIAVAQLDLKLLIELASTEKLIESHFGKEDGRKKQHTQE